ncbi:hypothetical protein SAMN02787148_116115 [Burkholderia vietnamiensis]|nr:hypothetical protein SAMN02787148_116115 [Burkholderia vietnamiensis]SFY21484.1 hypothetical protein SAMN02787160_116115 [Burkholderia vietnamiensis]
MHPARSRYRKSPIRAQQHTGIVQHPVVITLDGVATELTLADAVKLRDGLAASIAATEAAESATLARNGHHFTIGKTMYGMSAVPSKLPA